MELVKGALKEMPLAASLLFGIKNESDYLCILGFSLVSLWFQAEKGTLPPLECLSFANTIQADLLTCGV